MLKCVNFFDSNTELFKRKALQKDQHFPVNFQTAKVSVPLVVFIVTFYFKKQLLGFCKVKLQSK